MTMRIVLAKYIICELVEDAATTTVAMYDKKDNDNEDDEHEVYHPRIYMDE